MLLAKICLGGLSKDLANLLLFARRQSGGRKQESTELGRTGVRRHAKSQRALHKTPHCLQVAVCTKSVRVRSIRQAEQTNLLLLLTPVELFALDFERLVIFHAELEFTHNCLPLSGRRSKIISSALQNYNTPSGKPLLVVHLVKLFHRQGHNRLHNALLLERFVCRGGDFERIAESLKILFPATWKDDYKSREMWGENEVPALHNIRRQDIDKVPLRQSATFLLCDRIGLCLQVLDGSSLQLHLVVTGDLKLRQLGRQHRDVGGLDGTQRFFPAEILQVTAGRRFKPLPLWGSKNNLGCPCSIHLRKQSLQSSQDLLHLVVTL
mmetsp:Transcript_11825/g.26116  ORF Transcript_11825/g.26116 Transcript_11825/m.26116 type:complete len:323 (+) Transcript_11825:241-1209(+)